MNHSLKSYPAMKDSGVPSLGEVPDHWEMRQLGRIGKFSKGNGGTKEDEVHQGVPCIRYGDLYTQHRFFIERSRACITLERSSVYTPIQYGDVLFAASGETIEEIGKSAVNLIKSPAYCGGDVILFRPSVSVEARFLGYATDCRPAAHQKSCMGRGITVMHIYGDQLKYLWVALPPFTEQWAIVRFLDHMDRRIGLAIRAKLKLIALLNEQKQATIHQAVTRGLDPNIRLKPSNVEWLGDVPVHWEVQQLGRIGKFLKGNGGTKEDEVSEGIPCIRYGDLYTQHQYFIEQCRAYVTAERSSAYTPIKYGDVLFAASGETIEEIGKSAVNLIEVEACCGGDVILFRPSNRVDARFMGYAIDSPQAAYQKSCMGRGITVMHIYGVQLKYMWITQPPVGEQSNIAKYIDQANADIDTTIDRTQHEIELLAEYRTRLIAEVVTGKLDVQEAENQLPMDIEEPETLDEVNVDGEGSEDNRGAQVDADSEEATA